MSSKSRSAPRPPMPSSHFREEHVTPDGECERNDEKYAYVAAWEFKGVGQTPVLHKEQLTYEEIHLATRSYK